MSETLSFIGEKTYFKEFFVKIYAETADKPLES